MNRTAGLIQDARYAARMLLRSPGLTLAATVCLGIGIGITASIFSQLRSMVLQDLPGVRLPAKLVRLQSATSYPNFEAYRDRSGQFGTLTAYMSPVPFVLTSPDGQRDRVWGQLVTPNYFSVLGVQAQAGRMLSPGEQRAGAAPAAIISYRLWQSRFGGRGDLVGRTIRLNGHPVEVAGVASRDFLGASPMLSAADVWVPVTVEATIAPELGRNVLQDYTARNFQLIGRLKSGLTRQQAEAALDATARQLEQFYNDPNRDRKERRVTLLPGGRLLPIQDKDLPSVLGFPLLFVGLILFMTCVNIATLLLARVAARRREISVRVALGAGRGRIVRQWLIESTFLGVLGGLAGLVVAVWRNSSVGPISRILPPYMRRSPRLSDALPALYLRGLSTGDFEEAIPALLGADAAGFSASSISRLTSVWQEEHEGWSKRPLTGKEYVYVWADGVYFGVRLGEDKQLACLVLIGVLPDGTKEVIALQDGYRESTDSWLSLLRDLKGRGMAAPRLAIGDGALGFWAALRQVYSGTQEQRCWVHKIANVLDKLPKRVQPRAKDMLHEIMYAPDRPGARQDIERFSQEFQAK